MSKALQKDDCGVWGDIEIRTTKELLKIRDVRFEQYNSVEEIKTTVGKIVQVRTLKKDSCKRDIVVLKVISEAN